MCLAMPGKIVSIEGRDHLGPRAKVDFGGVIKEVSLACLTFPARWVTRSA